MQILKIIGLGLLFSFIGAIGLLVIGLGPVTITTGPQHAIGLSAILAGLIEAAVFNPIFWLGILVAFGLAFWVVKRKR